MMAGWEFCLFLRVVGWMDGGSCHGMMIMAFCMAVLVRACGAAFPLYR
jgi:hypothetical protein